MSLSDKTPPRPQMLYCACATADRHECWRRRYRLPQGKSVEEDGGPCGCVCHDAPEPEQDQS